MVTIIYSFIDLVSHAGFQACSSASDIVRLWIQPAEGSGALDLFLLKQLACRRIAFVLSGAAVVASLTLKGLLKCADYQNLIRHVFCCLFKQ